MCTLTYERTVRHRILSLPRTWHYRTMRLIMANNGGMISTQMFAVVLRHEYCRVWTLIRYVQTILFWLYIKSVALTYMNVYMFAHKKRILIVYVNIY